MARKSAIRHTRWVKLFVIGLDQTLIQLVLLLHQVFNDLPQLQTALLIVILHILKSSLVLPKYDFELLLIISARLHVRYYCVADHLRILSEPQRAKSLLELYGRGRDAKHNSCPGVASQGRPQDLGQWRISVRYVLIGPFFACAALSLEGYHLGEKEERLVDVLTLFDPHA